MFKCISDGYGVQKERNQERLEGRKSLSFLSNSYQTIVTFSVRSVNVLSDAYSALDDKEYSLENDRKIGRLDQMVNSHLT